MNVRHEPASIRRNLRKGNTMTRIWHWTEPAENGVLEVRIEDPDRSVNVFSRAALDELAELVAFIASRPGIRGVLFYSGKPGCFIAGADVTELKELKGVQDALEVSGRGQQVFAELERLSVPTVALIAGACLGAVDGQQRLAGRVASRVERLDDHELEPSVAGVLDRRHDVALDARGAALFTEFLEACAALQERYDRTPSGPWRMEPKNLEINMNG